MASLGGKREGEKETHDNDRRCLNTCGIDGNIKFCEQKVMEFVPTSNELNNYFQIKYIKMEN